MESKDVGVIILAGGFGTRLQPVISDRPKILAPVADTTVLDIVLDDLFDSGFKDITLCVGYMKEKMYEHMSGRSVPNGAIVSFSEEDSPLGTGGAVKYALSHARTETALILNGDTIFPINYALFLEQHARHAADISIALCHVENASRYGTVVTDDTDRIKEFREKDGSVAPGIINGGKYIFKKGVLEKIDLPTVFSLEKELFEKHADNLRMYGFAFADHFIDIGLPEDYAHVQEMFKPR